MHGNQSFERLYFIGEDGLPVVQGCSVNVNEF